jgi:hypothetical protein
MIIAPNNINCSHTLQKNGKLWHSGVRIALVSIFTAIVVSPKETHPVLYSDSDDTQRIDMYSLYMF